MTPIAPHMEAFMRERLPIELGASINTCDSYAHAFRLLLQYASERLKVRPSELRLEQLDAPLILDFLKHLENRTPEWPEFEEHASGGHQIVHALHGVPGALSSGADAAGPCDPSKEDRSTARQAPITGGTAVHPRRAVTVRARWRPRSGVTGGLIFD
jgi:hypothetical protein